MFGYMFLKCLALQYIYIFFKLIFVVVLILKINLKKNIILKYFQTKNTLKNHLTIFHSPFPFCVKRLTKLSIHLYETEARS